MNHCATCEHFKFCNFCYRYPPVVAGYKKLANGKQDWTAIYPPVAPTSVACGEWRIKELTEEERTK